MGETSFNTVQLPLDLTGDDFEQVFNISQFLKNPSPQLQIFECMIFDLRWERFTNALFDSLLLR